MPIFWIISGIVFYKFYFKSIENKTVNIQKFVRNRFTRLYPLHFLTLIIVALLQIYYFSIHKSYFIYINNLKYFVLNVLFIQNWNTNPINLGSFNGPAWSVSVELFVYLVFFVICLTKAINNNKLILLLILVAIVCEGFHWGLVNFNQCLYFFFAGCLLEKSFENNKQNLYKALFAFLGYFIVHFLLRHYLNDNRTVNNFLQAIGDIHGAIQLLFICLCIVYLVRILFDLRIFHKINPNIFSLLGNLTYSMYLIHFPLQLVFYIVINPTSYTVFNAPIVFLSYVGTTIIFGYLAFNYFEKIVQRKLRLAFDH